MPKFDIRSKVMLIFLNKKLIISVSYSERRLLRVDRDIGNEAASPVPVVAKQLRVPPLVEVIIGVSVRAGHV